MSKNVLVIGNSGCGKSTAIRTLPSDETMLINVIGKPLPFRGYKKKYLALSPDGMEGNYYASDDFTAIARVIKLVNTKRTDIKYLVIDDFGYTLTNNFMKKAQQRGYDKFIDLAKDTFDVLDLISKLRDDLFCFVMMHTEIDAKGVSKPKSIGKMIDSYICIEGKFTYAFHSLVNDGRYEFLTNMDGQHISKTPLGMFDELYIPNDLALIVERINEYED